MFPSFTGSARPKRQVNLSGRNANPFAATSGIRQPTPSQTGHSALAQAQQERLLRKQERERPPAAKKIQSAWRGFKCREQMKNQWRREWDIREAADLRIAADTRSPIPTLPYETLDRPPYRSEELCLAQLRLLVQYVCPKTHVDILRLDYFASRFLSTLQILPSLGMTDVWKYPLQRLAKLAIGILRGVRIASLPNSITNRLLLLLTTLCAIIPSRIALYAHQYYRAMVEVSHCLNHQDPHRRLAPESLEGAISSLLKPITVNTTKVYQGFLSEYIVNSILSTLDNILARLAEDINYERLTTALNELLLPRDHNLLHLKDHDELLWLLAYYLHFHRVAPGLNQAPRDAPEAQYINAVAKFLSFLGDDIAKRVDLSGNISNVDDMEFATSKSSVSPLPTFVHNEILTLVNQDSVSSLFTHLDVAPLSQNGISEVPTRTSTLASFALTLLRCFPRKADDIRMWLYLGSTSRHSNEAGRTEKRLPAIKYLYQAIRNTNVYSLISKDPRQTISLIRSNRTKVYSGPVTVQPTAESIDQQWRVLLLFFELYTFILKVMDDEEFLSGSSPSGDEQSWTRQSALPLDQIRELTIFLSNLAFAMYWYASEISGIELPESKNSLAEYFSGNTNAFSDTRDETHHRKSDEIAVAGVSRMTLSYVKGVVTGLLRMIYERDSRRKFLPRDHWLMTKWFEMDRFILAVVAEEEHKNEIQDSYGPDANVLDIHLDDEDTEEENADNLIGTRRTQQVRNIERLRRQQRRPSRKKYLESVTPRLEILQNMPFFIPFTTRVQIFREFVKLDQLRRRGYSDPDEWRYRVITSSGGDIAKYRAKVRRQSIFNDAYEQFYELGEGLKEPIQIRFVDQFDTVEEGIDGGGVTKEFLTSVTKEMFNPGSGENMFIENDQHLLYPNPSAVDEVKDALRQSELKEGSAIWNDSIRDFLRRFEFLGRIIGKCLYEGILVDIHFAGFFLLKWALTGGSGAATRESSYRANINDLRDLDEGLYQGLLQLKNYPGDVEDFSLNFAVTDTIPSQSKDSSKPTTITRDLRPGGSQISVTNENRLVYISYIARYRLQIQPQLQTAAFLRGLGTIISPSWLSMFNQSELQTLVGGDSSEIDVADLRRNTIYSGIYAIGDDHEEHACVKLFWQAMYSFSDADRRKVLKFVTSTPRAPLLGFDQLHPRFSIRDSGHDQTRLPSTSTCVNLLKLPIYDRLDTLKDRLLYSVNAGAGFNLS